MLDFIEVGDYFSEVALSVNKPTRKSPIEEKGMADRESSIAEGMMELMKSKSRAAAQAALSTEATEIVEQAIKQLSIKSGGFDTHQDKLSDAFMEYIEKLSPAQLGELACQFDSDIVAYMHALYGEPNYQLKSFRDVLKVACHSTLMYEALRLLGDG
jgi:hypothetical protein